MTVMLMAMLMSDAALTSNKYRDEAPEPKSSSASKVRAWISGIKVWDKSDDECPGLLQEGGLWLRSDPAGAAMQFRSPEARS